MKEVYYYFAEDGRMWLSHDNLSFIEYLHELADDDNFSTDSYHIEQLSVIAKQTKACNELPNQQLLAVATYLDQEVINKLNLEIMDKYSATTFILRVVRIIKLAQLPSKFKLILLNSFYLLIKAETIANIDYLSQERNFWAQKKYGIDLVISGASSPVNRIQSVSHLAGIYYYLSVIGASILGEAIITLFNLQFNQTPNNTTSLQNACKLIKNAILDELPDYLAEQAHVNQSELSMAEQILASHRGRQLTQWGATQTSRQWRKFKANLTRQSVASIA